jgi:hypothetical protein
VERGRGRKKIKEEGKERRKGWHVEGNGNE